MNRIPSARQRAWAGAEAARVRRQIDAAAAEPVGSDWRARGAKARLLARLRAREASLVRQAGVSAVEPFREDLPF